MRYDEYICELEEMGFESYEEYPECCGDCECCEEAGCPDNRNPIFR